MSNEKSSGVGGEAAEMDEPQPDMSLVDITDGENERKIPRVKFPEDVEAFANSFSPPASAELLIGAYTELHNKFKSFEANLEQKKGNYQVKIPDLEKSLALVKTLLKKQEEGEGATIRYNLCESVYGKAEVDTSSGIVNLWLGANVMLEYTYDEAIDFLSSSLETHRGDFRSVQDDLAFVRDQIVTCEVCMTRTYNWSVRKRRMHVLHVSMTWKRIGNLFWASFVLASQVSCQTREDQKLVTEVDLTRVDFSDQDESATLAMGALMEDIDRRLFQLFEKTKTAECRQKIAQHYGYFTKALGLEKPLPFSEIAVFNNTCDDEYPWDFDNLPEGVHLGIIQNRTYQPPRNESEYIHASEIVICYGILAHDSAPATIRLIEAVNEPTTHFVVHVDAKYEDTHRAMKRYALSHPRVKVLDQPYRVRVNWGGFSMVNATIQLMNFADKLDFTHFVHIASTAYPIASNARIRNTLAAYPKDANFMHVILKPARPHPSIWNYYVECDDRLHRIYRLTPLTPETHNASVYTTSQWFIISREFVRYFANPDPGSFVSQYLQYVEHVVVADESFFGTVLRHTPFCNKHHNWNFLHLQFDQWENERDLELRDERKCVMPDPNHCGRSPTTMTLDYLDILELSGDLFARKFDDHVDSTVKDVIDAFRIKEESELKVINGTIDGSEHRSSVNLRLDGHGTLFVAKVTVNSTVPLCLGIGETQHKVRLIPCFEDWVPQTLAPNWYAGAVILEETLPHNRWEIGPCSTNGNLTRTEDGEVEVIPGTYNPTGPRCMIRMMDGIRAGRCLDGDSLDSQPGGPVHIFPCTKRWNQFFSFGNGKEVPKMTIHTNVPLHTRKRIAETGRAQEPYMCLGVPGRGKMDEEDWLGVRGEENENDSSNLEEVRGTEAIDKDSFSLEEDDSSSDETGPGELSPLSQWERKQLIATRCSNTDALIEWLVVPFIMEDYVTSDVGSQRIDEEVEEL